MQEITSEQLHTMYTDLRSLGYGKPYDVFMEDAAKFCKKFLGKDVGLTDKEAKPYVLRYSLKLLESLTLPNLEEKIFALCTLSKRSQTYARVPIVSMPKENILSDLIEVNPDIESYLTGLNETLTGFAPPVYTAAQYKKCTKAYRKGMAEDLRVSVKKKKKEIGDDVVYIEEIAKISLTVKTGAGIYEVPLYHSMDDTSSCYTSVYPVNREVLLEDVSLVPLEIYEPMAKSFNRTVNTYHKTFQNRR